MHRALGSSYVILSRSFRTEAEKGLDSAYRKLLDLEAKAWAKPVRSLDEVEKEIEAKLAKLPRT